MKITISEECFKEETDSLLSSRYFELNDLTEYVGLGQDPKINTWSQYVQDRESSCKKELSGLTPLKELFKNAAVFQDETEPIRKFDLELLGQSRILPSSLSQASDTIESDLLEAQWCDRESRVFPEVRSVET